MTTDRRGADDDQSDALVAHFGDAVGRRLHEWALVHGSRLTPLEPLTGGFTDARVVLVLERPSTGPPRKAVVKVCRPEEDGDRLPEPGRHIKVQVDFPDFADRHVVRMLHEPVQVGDGYWALFMEPAGGGAPGTVPLVDLVDRTATPRTAHGQPGDFERLGKACHDIVLSVLQDWSPSVGRSQPMKVASFVGKLLDGRQRPGGGVHTWVAAHRPDLLEPGALWTDVDGERCPNPLGLAPGGAFGEGRRILALRGPTHGDLHAGNVYVPVKRVWVRGQEHLPYENFWLADLERFDSDGLLASEPVHLLLSLAARQLPHLTLAQQAELRRFLIEPDEADGGLLLRWMGFVASQIVDAVPHWIKGFPGEWRDQTLLAMAAWGLVFAGRRTTADDQREWFFGLAAMAAKAYLGDGGLGARLVAVPPPADPSGGADARIGAVPGTDVAVDRTEGGDHIARSPGGGIAERRRMLAPHLLEASNELAERIGEQWRRAAEDRGLTSPEPVPVRWVKATGAQASEVTPLLRHGQVAVHPSDDWRLGDHPPATGLFPLYCSVGSGAGRLVITGEAGAGKSAAAILLALDILAYRTQLDHDADRAAVAVPVILTPHDWDPRHEDLVSWMTQKLASDYPLLGSRQRGRRAVEELIRGRRIALFLDGFDEIPAERRADALRALRDQAGMIVVLCRPEAPVDLAGAPTVELQPIALDEAVDYLARCDGGPGATPALERVRRKPDSALALALESPLMVGLLRDASVEIDDLLDPARFPHRADVERHLLRQVVARAYPQEVRAERWLESFAHLMSENGTRELAWWRLQHHVPRWKRFVAGSLLASFCPALLFGSIGALGGRPGLGLACGVAIGLLTSAFDTTVVDRDKGRGPRKAATTGIALGYVVAGGTTGAMAGVLLMGVAAGLPNGTLAGVVAGGLGGAVAAPAAARHLAASGRPTSAVEPTRTPGEEWRLGARQSRWFGLLLGATVAVTLASVSWKAGGPVAEVVGTAMAGFVAMPFAVLALSPTMKVRVTALQLWRERRTPVRVLRFLEEAREKDVLRAVGPVYQFRHARLQDLLADQHRRRSGSS